MKNRTSLLLTSLIISSVLILAPPEVFATGQKGKALDFDGISDYVQVADSADLKGMSELSLEAWIKPDAYPQYAGIIAKWTYPTRMQYILGYFSAGNISFWVGSDTAGDMLTVPQPSVGVWTHVAAVFRGGATLEIFYNGTSQGNKPTAVASIGATVEPLYIGKYNGYEFDGTIDEVRVYNRTLSVTEIQEHYSAGTGQYGRPETGLVAGWHFDEGSGTIASDYSGNAHDGTVNGDNWVEGIIPIPDIEVTSVTRSSGKVISGDIVTISVAVENHGACNESFSVTAYYDSSSIETQPVVNLLPSSVTNLVFLWNTAGVPLGTYTIKANATIVQGEVNTTNNEKVDDTVWIVQYPTASFDYSPKPIIENHPGAFDASASSANGGTITKYTWDFGDGNITTTTNPIIAHTYALHGDYTVKLTVEDSEDLNDTTSKIVEVRRHDIAVIDVSPARDWIYETWTIDINVTLTNQGNFTENPVVNVYFNSTGGPQLIGTQTVGLDPGETKILTFVWDTTGVEHCHNYTITANATIPIESDNSDNVLQSPTLVRVRLLGDISGDDYVGIDDINTMTQYFGAMEGQPRWNPDADFSTPSDGYVGIDDIFFIAQRFGTEP